jgi:hypothetical protein
MNRYIDQGNGYVTNGEKAISMVQALREVEEGNAVIEQYIKPAPSAEEIFNDAVQPLFSGISQVERDTFPTQASEAKEWEADNNAEVEFIRDLAASRGISIDLLVGKIMKKAAPYSKAIAGALGTKHKAEDATEEKLLGLDT